VNALESFGSKCTHHCMLLPDVRTGLLIISSTLMNLLRRQTRECDLAILQADFEELHIKLIPDGEETGEFLFRRVSTDCEYNFEE
jgi:hypothetical protein